MTHHLRPILPFSRGSKGARAGQEKQEMRPSHFLFRKESFARMEGFMEDQKRLLPSTFLVLYSSTLPLQALILPRRISRHTFKLL